jgi:hypothetical protein
MPAARYATLSERAAITPAIEAQLERVLQRHADLLQQLSGDAMSRWEVCCRLSPGGLLSSQRTCRLFMPQSVVSLLLLPGCPPATWPA